MKRTNNLFSSFYIFVCYTYPIMEDKFEEVIIMLTTIVLKFKLAKLKYYTRKETKAFYEGRYDDAIKFGKLVGKEFDKIFG